MFRRPPRPVTPIHANPMEGIRFLEDPAPAPTPPKKDEKTTPTATATTAPPRKRREWPIATPAFLLVVGTGLVLRSAGLPGMGRARAEEEVTRTLAVSEAPRVVVETFNGPIEVNRGASGNVDCV